MSSNLAKYAYTEKGVIILSNCMAHQDAVMGVFGDIPILNKGFIEIKVNEEGKLDFDLHAVIAEGEINEVCENNPDLRKAVHDLLFCVENHAEYVVTFTRFIVFPAFLSHKDIADHLFYDFNIKGAGNMVFEIVDGKPHAKTYGQATVLEMEANKVDEEILNVGFHLV